MRRSLFSFSRRCYSSSISRNYFYSLPKYSSNSLFVNYNNNNIFNYKQQNPLFLNLLRYNCTSTQSNNNTNNSNDPHMFELGEDMLVTINEFKGHFLVHIREYYYHEQVRKPGKKGVTLTIPSFTKLAEFFDDIDADFERLSQEQGNFDKKFDFILSNNRKAFVHMIDSNPLLVFEHSGQNGIKTVSIKNEQYNMLKVFYPNIKSILDDFTKEKYDNSTIYQVVLSEWVTTKVITLGTSHYVDIRKTPKPVEGQQVKSGGIALRVQEWQTFVSNLEPLYTAIRNGDLNYQLPLGSNRFVSINYYKETWYIVIREYFTPKNETKLIPGKKGINLRVEEWSKFVAEIPNITNHLNNALNNTK